MRLRSFQHSSVVHAPIEAVWSRVTDFAGINDELMPLMRMRVPPGLRGASIETVPLGVPLGRAWLLVLGFLPLEYDDLMLTEVEAGVYFQEVSTMASMRRWEHRRELRAEPGGRTRVTDAVGFEPRVPAVGGAMEPVVRGLFAHRHRRLARHFAQA